MSFIYFLFLRFKSIGLSNRVRLRLTSRQDILVENCRQEEGTLYTLKIQYVLTEWELIKTTSSFVKHSFVCMCAYMYNLKISPTITDSDKAIFY